MLPHASNVDVVLVMTAEPGIKGQEGVVNPRHKVETLRQKYPDLLIWTDSWEQLSTEQVSLLKQEFIIWGWYSIGGGGGVATTGIN